MDSDFPPSSPIPNQTPPPPPPPPLPSQPPASALQGHRKPTRSGRGWKVATLVLAVLLGFSFLSNISQFFLSLLGGSADGLGGELPLLETVVEHNGSKNKIAVIPVQGVITSSDIDGKGRTMANLIEDQLKMAGKDERVKAVLLKVNSPGGEVLASDDIANAISAFQQTHGKPVIASLGSLAASGGYYVSAPCRWIVANELTITGSIGVILHTYNYRGLMNKVGLRPMTFKSGRFKDMLSGDRDLEKLSPAEQRDLKEEEAMITKLVTETYTRFKQVVTEGRAGANRENQTNNDGATGQKLSPDWIELADGRVLSGREAFENGFVDELGNWHTAVKRAQSISGINDANLVTYQLPFNFGNILGLLGKTDAQTVKLDLGLDLPNLQAGLYYLAPTFLR